MKNEINRMKTRAASVSTRTIAVLMCFVMLLTAIGTGTMMTALAVNGGAAGSIAEAAKKVVTIADTAKPDVVDADTPDTDSSEEIGLITRNKDDIAAVGANVELASSGWYLQNNARIYFDASAWYKGADTFPNYMFMGMAKSGDTNGRVQKMTRISGTSIYYIENTSNTANDGSLSSKPYVLFFSAYGSGWESNSNNISTSNISTWQGNGDTSSMKYYYTTGYDNDVRNGYTYYYRAQSGTGKQPYLDKEYSNKTTDINSDTFTVWKSTEKASVYTDYTTAGTYAYVGDDNTNKGGKVKAGAKYFNAWNSVSNLGYSNDDTGGSATYSQYDKAAKSAQVSLVVTETFTGYTFAGWYNSSGTRLSTSTTYTFYTDGMNTETNDIQARFTYSRTLNYYLTGYINGKDYSGESYKFSGSGDNYTFTLDSTTASQYLTIKDSNGTAYHPTGEPAGNGAKYTTTNTSPTADPKWGITSGASGKKITFTWKPESKTLSWTVGTSATVDIYAKDGVAPINWDEKTKNGATDLGGYNENNTTNYYYGFGRIATTTLSGNATGITTVKEGYKNISDSNSWYQKATADTGKTITVTTTIDGLSGQNWRTRYYVVGWSVNGVTYKEGTDTVGVNSNPGTSKTSYTFTYTIPDADSLPKDVAGNPVVEITPIFYLQSKTNVITFYLEGFTDVQSKWGNTPYVYPFYGNLSGYQNAYGVYPGQPMVNVAGQYSIEVPIYASSIDSSKTPASTVIKGVTISNGYADHVHRNLVYGWTTATGDVGNDKDHMQTYDFDDFYKIYEERLVSGQHPNAIFFRIKEKTTKYNRSTYGGGSTSGQFASGTSTINISTIATSGNGWELMKDRHDRNVNIFGDYSAVSSVSASSATADTSKAIYVVSTGYNANIAGDYGTMWKIYDGSGKLISTDTSNGRYGIPPSLLNLRGSASGYSTTVSYPSASRSVEGVGDYTDSNAKYEGIYKTLKSSYTGKIVYITYEKDTQDTRKVSTGTGAYRLDGKWFYTHASDTVKSTVGIEYYDKSSGKWIADTVNASTGKGTTTKATVQFDSDSYASSSNITTSKSTVTSAATTLNFTASDSGEGYAFDGWFLQYDNSYDPVSGATSKGSIKSTANYKLVARYIPVVTGSLTVSYKLDPTSTGTKDTMSLSVKYGNNTAVDGTLGDDGVYRATVTGLTYTTSASNIVVTLKTKPKNHGKVSAFGADSKITSYKAQSSPTLPGGENTEVTKTYTLTNQDLYSEADHTNQLITDLEFTTKIDATPHYYEFTYNFTTRDNLSRKYVSRGEISEEHYVEYVTGTTINDAFVKSRAPFESNFLQTLKLGTITKSYNTTSHTFTASATYSASAYTPVYDVKIKLPYNYLTSTSGGVKKYGIANDSAYNANIAAFTLKANYDEFVTIGATDSKPGTQTESRLKKDTSTNHTGNDFITAPDTLKSGNTTMYFQYWEIKRLADTDTAQASAPIISRVYFPDLNYRFYADSYVEAIYTNKEAEYWSNVKKNGTNDELSCSVLYLESSRNQWNMNGQTSNNATSAVAADKIYNDFMFSYRLGDKEKFTSAEAEIGVVLERVYYTQDGTNAWAKGSTSVTNMDSYKSSYGDTESARKSMIENYLKNGSGTFTGCVKVQWDNSELNNKNYTEQNYSVYSQYGQTVASHSVTFATNSSNDDYVYRAWAYIKDKDGNVAVSDPAYFSMNYVATQNYSE